MNYKTSEQIIRCTRQEWCYSAMLEHGLPIIAFDDGEPRKIDFLL